MAADLANPRLAIPRRLRHLASGVINGVSAHRPEVNQLDDVLELLDAWPDAVIVQEDFILRVAIKSREVLSPVRHNMVVEYHAHIHSRVVYQNQTAELVKKTWPDQRLKDERLYVAGPDHERDARRHLLTFLGRARDSAMLRHKAWLGVFPHPGKLVCNCARAGVTARGTVGVSA
jgi:hypothetical protein